MQEASLAVADPGHRPAQPHQFAGVDLRRPKGYAAAAPEPVQEAVNKVAEGDPCPRCASRDTKFCYYNNYNTSQPRHFCKGCRRYWTKGGTLRNVPVGGGTRKKPSSSSSTQPSSYAAAGAGADIKPPAKKKRRVEAPAPEPAAVATSAAADPVAAADSAKTTTTTTTTTTTDGASDITTETTAVLAGPAAPVVEEDSDSLAHLLLQPGAEDAVALGLGLSDFPSVGKALPLLDDDSFQWPATYDLGGACWASTGFGASAGFVDPDPTGLFLNLP